VTSEEPEPVYPEEPVDDFPDEEDRGLLGGLLGHGRR
jgi:hypothetical protein